MGGKVAFGSHLEIDLQQRGVEFSQLFRKHNAMRTALLEPMPPMERDTTMLDEQPEQIQGRDNPIFRVLLENYGPGHHIYLISPIRTFLKFIFL